ncbi:MAG: hypothetical protein FJZ01_12125 [Candidatus Sericytochromatia bacterium]|nr:hypothetical protein [Candidatus Tanganyikabacteria bacterium]
MRRQVHGLPLLAALAAGLAIWLLACGGAVVDLRVAAALGLLFATPAPDAARGLLDPHLADAAGDRPRLAAAAGVGLLLAFAVPLARGAIPGPVAGLVVLAVVTARLVTPLGPVVAAAAALLVTILLS